MFKKTITYEDFDGNERTEDFYFHLKKNELMEMQLSISGGWTNLLQNIIQEKDSVRLTEFFKEIIAKTYGKKSLDGRRFSKTPEILAEFQETEAYSKLFMELAFDSDAAAEFVENVIPKLTEADFNIGKPQDHKAPGVKNSGFIQG